MGHIRRGLLSVEVLNFEDLTEDSKFGGAEFEPAARLQVSLIAPELYRWTANGPVPMPLGPLSEGMLEGDPAAKGPRTLQRCMVVAGVACVGAPLLHIECFSAPLAPIEDAGDEDDDRALPTPSPAPLICTELVSTEAVVDPTLHAREQQQLKHALQREIEKKQAEFEENPKDKALEQEIRQLEVDLDAPVPPPPTLEKEVVLLLEDGREAARISVSIGLALDPEIPALDDSMAPEEEAGMPERPDKCARPVEEAFAAATSVIDTVISDAVDNWLDYVFQRQARQYAAAYCLQAASAVIDLAELAYVGEPTANSTRAHRKAPPTTQELRPLSGPPPPHLISAVCASLTAAHAPWLKCVHA